MSVVIRNRSDFFRFGFYRILYQRYREVFTIVFSILIALILVLQAIIPQIQDFLAIRQQERLEQEKINILQNNLKILSSEDENEIDNKVSVASAALPTEKDFGGILNSISQAAGNSGVNLGDYSFTVGDISEKANNDKGRPFIEIILNTRGTIAQTKDFLRDLSEKLPLSEIKHLTLSQNSSTVIAHFYYKSFPALIFNEDAPIQLLSASDDSTLQTLTAWKERIIPNFPLSTAPIIPATPATSSGNLLVPTSTSSAAF